MKLFLAALLFFIRLALVPFAWDWPSPFLAEVRPWALLGLIILPLGVILAEVWLLITSPRDKRALSILSQLGLMAAVLVFSLTLALEARFHWDRHQVLHANPARLERLGRHFVVGYRNLAEVRQLVTLQAIAGVFISGSNVRGKTVAEIAGQIKSLQQIRREQNLPPLWIATDQEGGPVSRLSPPLTRLPALSELVFRYPDNVRLKQAVRELATEQGRELAEVGVNLNFAPVVDINHHVMNPDDKYTRIYERAISTDPSVVAEVAAWYCAALEDAGVHCTLKHFPGLGRVSGDTHLRPASLSISLNELTKTDWVPFRALMRDSKAFIMLAHVRLTAIDGKRPASMSPGVISGLLRGDWKYDPSSTPQRRYFCYFNMIQERQSVVAPCLPFCLGLHWCGLCRFR